MKNYFPDNKVNLCKQYIKTLTKETWPENETLKVDGVYNLQIWKNDGKFFSAIFNSLNKDWIFISTIQFKNLETIL